MGRTSTANKPLPLYLGPKQLSVSWELNPAGVKASKKKIFSLTAFMLWPSYNGHFWGYIFFGGISPSKIGHIAPFLATIQALSKTRVFLYTQKKSRMLCMGRT
jgi:hypothetical protein